MKAQPTTTAKRVLPSVIKLSSIVICFITLFSFTQTDQGTVTGILTDYDTGLPLIGASIAVQGTTNGTYTDYDGSWSLELSKGTYKIEFAYMGYKTEVRQVYVSAENISQIDVALTQESVNIQSVVMKTGYASKNKLEDKIISSPQVVESEESYYGYSSPDAIQVNTVVKTGYMSQKKEDVTGSIAQIRGSEIANKPVLSVDQALQGRAAGVQVRSNSGTPGASMDIVIRGRGTLGDARPLYVVDGVPIGNEYRGDPSDIENISILKDASSCAMYGARGANGVVLITLKGGNKYKPYVPEVYVPEVYVPEPVVEPRNPLVENKMIDALVETKSTFSIDVDRAAYTYIRQHLNSNMKPDVDEVRLEEMVNYFKYNYPQPEENEPFSINIESKTCPWNFNNKLVLIGLQGREVEKRAIPASNLVFLIDVSGSMSGADRLGLLKRAFGELVNNLREQDRVSIVVYAGAAGLVLPPTSGAQKSKILNSLHNLQAGGSTAGGAGIELAYNIAKQSFITGGNNRVILATDGDFNVGASSNEAMVKLIETKRDEGVFLSILGFGMGNYQDQKMEQLSNAGNGNYAYIDNFAEAQKVFGVELWGTLLTIAKDVKIQVEFNPAIVKSYRLIGYENRMLQKEDFENDKKDAGEVGSGHSVTAMYEIVFVDSIAEKNESKYVQQVYPNSNDLMTVNVRYKEPDGTTSKLISKVVSKNNIPEGENIRFASCVAQFGLILRNSEFKGHSTFAQIIQETEDLDLDDKNGYRKEFLALVKKAQKIYQSI